jgi:AraC-like DNA-binding protein
VHVWRTTFSPEADVRVHRVAKGVGHSLLVPLVTSIFEGLRVSASVWEHGQEWWAIHNEPSLQGFEIEHDNRRQRDRYNTRCLEAARTTGTVVRGEHAGYSDLFVPILVGGRATAILVVGQFATARPTSADVLSRWLALTGRQGHPADPEFASYLEMTLATLVLDDDDVLAFERLLVCLAQLMGGEGRADRLMNQIEPLQRELREARAVERTWETVRSMVDERTPRKWYTTTHGFELRHLGLTRTVDHVLVGLAVSRGEDPVDDAIRQNELQREAVELARKAGDAIAGQVGEHGVVLLSGGAGALLRKRRKAADLAERVAELARRRFALSMHFGLSAAAPPDPLSRTYQAALGAAQSALAQRIRIVTAQPLRFRPGRSFRDLRQQLDAVAEERPAELTARFDRYLEAVALHCGYRLDAARGHLEAGFERLTEPLVRCGTLERRSFVALCDDLDRAAETAGTLQALFAAYRRATADVSAATQRPIEARHERSVRRAVDFIRRHYTEPLRLAAAARVAGFTPKYFSKLFAESERMPFERYVAKLRLERAKHLLASTDLGAERIAELSGYGSHQYFCRAFREAVGATPTEFRRRKDHK